MKSILLKIITSFLIAGVALAALAKEPLPIWPSYLLVGNKGEDSISFIDLNTGREVSRRPVSASAPHEIAVDLVGQKAAVVNYGSNIIDIFDIGTKTIQTSINLGENQNPHGIIWLPDGRIIATTETSDTIVVLTPTYSDSRDWDLQAIPTRQKGTHMVDISWDSKIAYTANMQSGTVSRIDLETKSVLSAPAGKEVEGVAVTQDGSEVWASVRGEDKVVIFDATTLERLSEIDVGKFPLRIIVSPDGKSMVTSNLIDGTVTVLDVARRTVERTITVSGSSETRQVTLLFNEDGSRLYVAETGANKIAEIDFASGELIGRLSGGEQGDGLAIVTGTQ